MSDLFPHQIESIKFHLEHRYSFNISSMGTGKTRIALESAKSRATKIAVFGPAFLKQVWEDEAKGLPFTYFSYSSLNKYSAKSFANFDFWIADECHYLKNPRAARTNNFYDFLEVCRPKYFLGLTGTPIKNKVPDIWTLLGLASLDPSNSNGLKLSGDLRSYNKFCAHFCEMEYQRVIGGRKIPKYGRIKEDKLPELHGYLKNKMIRFKLEDVVKDLPELRRKYVQLKLISNPHDMELQQDFDAYQRGSKYDASGKCQSAYLKARQTAQYCKELAECGSGPIVIFTDHIDSALTIGSDLNCHQVTGEMPSQMRMALVQKFQTGKMPFIVATIGSLSVGVTLTAARHVVFNDLSWVPADNLQAERRIHRIGQKNGCIAHYIESTPTDSYIRKKLMEKMKTIDAVIE